MRGVGGEGERVGIEGCFCCEWMGRGEEDGEMRGVGLEVYGVKWGGEGLFVLVGNTHNEGDVFDVAFGGVGRRNLDREVSVSGCWVL